jgi:uncharacterized protein YycO
MRRRGVVTYQPQRGDFGLTAGGGWPMRFVRLGTFSRYGHACIADEVHGDGTVTVIEPMPAGCRRRVARHAEFVWSDVDLSLVQRDQIVSYAETTLGLPYDWPAIFGFLLRFWRARLRGRSDDHPDQKLMCSELVVWAYRRAGVDLAPGKAPGDVSPGDLDQWLDNRRRA